MVSEEEYEKAVTFLNSVHADAHSSCLCEKREFAPEYDLDIIVPVYNVENYIKECIDSILNQKTQYKFRVIIVDDGSTDNSGKIIDKLYSDNALVKIVHQSNKGISGARNTGLLNVKSKYIMFVDSDDLMANGAIENLLNIAFFNDADCVQGGYEIFRGNIITYQKKYGDMQCSPKENIAGFPWGKVFKWQVFNGICFPQYWFEDTIIRNIIAFKIKKHFTSSAIVYRYRTNRKGISYRSRGNIKSIDTIWVFFQCLDDSRSLGIEREQVDYCSMLSHISLFSRRLKRLSPKVKRAAFIVFRHMVCNAHNKYSSPQDRNLSELEKALLYANHLKFKLISYC